MAARPARTPIKNLCLALASLLLTLLGIEIGLRFHSHLENRGLLSEDLDLGIEPPADGPADLGHMIRLSKNREIIYELKPDLDVSYAGARVRTDAYGFRSRTSPEELAAASYRIVGLGDSFMFGFGVAEHETYLSVVEDRLREHRPDLDLRILNTGVPGYNTVMEIAAFEEKALAYRPDLVILEFVGNDLFLPNFIRTRSKVLAVDRLFFVDFVKRRLDRSHESSLDGQLRRHGVETGLGVQRSEAPPEYRDMIGLPSYVRALRRLQALSREHGFTVVSITLAEPNPFHQQVMGVSGDMGFHVLHIGKVFRHFLDQRGIAQYLDSPLALSPDDGHPSAIGHRVAAGALVQFLRNEVLPMEGAGGSPPHS